MYIYTYIYIYRERESTSAGVVSFSMSAKGMKRVHVKVLSPFGRAIIMKAPRGQMCSACGDLNFNLNQCFKSFQYNLKRHCKIQFETSC